MIALNTHTTKGKKNTLVPENWNELRPAQLPPVAEALFLCASGQPAGDIILAQAMTGIKDFSKWAPDIFVGELLPLLEWAKKSTELHKQLLPQLPCGDITVYGPKSELENLVFVEFDFAERELYLWCKTPEDINLLYRFMACLYRPAKKGYDMVRNEAGDVRELFNDNLLPYLSAQLQDAIPLNVAQAVLLWYKGCRALLMERFPAVFQHGPVSTEEDQIPSYFPLMRSIAKEGTYGNFDSVERMLMYNALHEMDCCIADYNRMQEKMEDMKNGTY